MQIQIPSSIIFLLPGRLHECKVSFIIIKMLLHNLVAYLISQKNSITILCSSRHVSVFWTTWLSSQLLLRFFFITRIKQFQQNVPWCSFLYFFACLLKFFVLSLEFFSIFENYRQLVFLFSAAFTHKLLLCLYTTIKVLSSIYSSRWNTINTFCFSVVWIVCLNAISQYVFYFTNIFWCCFKISFSVVYISLKV